MYTRTCMYLARKFGGMPFNRQNFYHMHVHVDVHVYGDTLPYHQI